MAAADFGRENHALVCSAVTADFWAVSDKILAENSFRVNFEEDLWLENAQSLFGSAEKASAEFSSRSVGIGAIHRLPQSARWSGQRNMSQNVFMVEF